MNTRIVVVSLLAAAGTVSADTLNCGTAFSAGTRGTMIDLRNDGSSPIQLTSLDFLYWTGSSAPASSTVTFQAHTSPGGWTPNQGIPANWTLIGEQTYTLSGPSGSTEHLTLNGFVLNPGQTVGFAFFCTVPSITQGSRACTLEGNATGPYTNGTLTAIPGAVMSNLTFGANGIGIGTRMYSGSINYTVVTGTCYANCDASTNPPILNVNDFTCFLNLYAAGSSSANCDSSTNPPILNVNDFTCFINSYAAGCT